MKNISNLIFLDDPRQVPLLRKYLTIGSTDKIVPMTAHALWALEHSSLPHEPVCSFAETYEVADAYEQCHQPLFLLLKEIETYIGERCPELKFSGPGFLSGQVYYVGYSLSAIAKRFFLMKKVIEICSPDKVTILQGTVDPWFAGEGFACDPWISLIQAFTTDMGSSFALLPTPLPLPPGKSSPGLLSEWFRKFRRLSHRDGFERLYNKIRYSIDGRMDGLLRVLVVGEYNYDWEPVLSDLRRLKRGSYFSLPIFTLDQRPWTNYYGSYIRLNKSFIRRPIDVEAPDAREEEAQTLKTLFAGWLEKQGKVPEIMMFDCNIFPSLVPQISSMIISGPSLIRHIDRVARRALDIAKPDAVCFYSMPNLCDKRLAHICNDRGVPVISYQHGFGYSVQVSVKDEETDPLYADYFLTYGTKILPRSDSCFPAKAEYIAVGSSRIEQMTKRQSPTLMANNSNLNILWIAESSTKNTIVSSLTEDTKRYLTQKICLGLLGRAKKTTVVYRPLASCSKYDGITDWIRQENISHVKIDIDKSLETLIKISDIVVTDISSPTTWAEVLALKKPMILYCNPRQTLLTSEFMTDLDRACHWCKTPEIFINQISALIENPDNVINEKRKTDPTEFINHYILHEGCCSSHVISFLEEMHKNKKTHSFLKEKVR